MLVFEQDNKIYVFTSPHEHLNFTKLVSMIHVYINPIDTLIVAISRGAQIHGLNIVENFEVLFQHTSVVEFGLVMENDHIDYRRVARTARFMREVYGHKMNIVQGAKFESV